MAITSNNTGSQKEASAVGTALLASCLAGDSRGQLQMYELTHGLVYRLMVRMVGLQEAADLTQQVYLKLFGCLEKFSGHSKFETWLYRLAMNEALQYLRKNSRKRTVLAGDPVSPHQPEAERGENRELLEVAMSRIDSKLRSIFLLREVEGMSYRDIAEVVEIPEGTVGSRLNRARRDLQSHLLELGWRA